LSVAAFCRQARVPQASFYAWRRRLHDGAVSARELSMRRTSPKPSRKEVASFIEVKPPADCCAAGSSAADFRDCCVFSGSSATWPEVRQAGGIELYLPGRRCLVIRPGFDRPTLLDLLAILDAGTSRFAAADDGTSRFAAEDAGVSRFTSEATPVATLGPSGNGRGTASRFATREIGA
jgi:hypothetical protein